MTKTCFICQRDYEDVDGVGQETHYAFRHGLIAPVLVNGVNPTGEWAMVVEQGSRHTSNMRSGDVIELAPDEEQQCIDGRIRCKAKASRGRYCPMHGSYLEAR